MRRRGDRRQVVPRAGAEIHVGQHDHRDLLVDRVADPARLDELDLMPAAELIAHALRHVEIGREIVALREDHAAALLQAQRGREQLEEIDRRAVRRHHLAALGADQRRDLVADPLRQVDPARGVPAADQALAPLLLDRLADPLRHRLEQRPERVSVQIDHSLGQDEALAKPRHRIAAIEILAMLPVDHGPGRIMPARPSRAKHAPRASRGASITEAEAHLEVVRARYLHLARHATRLCQRGRHRATRQLRSLEIRGAVGDEERHAVSLDIGDRARSTRVFGPREKAAGVLGGAAVIEGRADRQAGAHRPVGNSMARPEIAPQRRERREVAARGVSAQEDPCAVAAVSPDLACGPGEDRQRVLELSGKPVRRRQPIIRGDEDRGQIHQRRRR